MVRKTISCMAIAVAAILTSVYTLTGCQSHQGDEDQLENDIDSFATYYFNWQFPKTLKYCTQSSEPWLRYAASNVHQADVDLLRTKAEDATVEINDIDFSDDLVLIKDGTTENLIDNGDFSKNHIQGWSTNWKGPSCYLANDAYQSTGITQPSVVAQPSQQDDAYYTLQGVRVSHPTSGIFIHKGRKIVMK